MQDANNESVTYRRMGVRALADHIYQSATDSPSAFVLSPSICTHRPISLTRALSFSPPFSVLSKSSWQHFRGHPAIKPQMPKSIIWRTIAFGTEFNEVVGEYGECAICGKIFRINQTPRRVCVIAVLLHYELKNSSRRNRRSEW